MNSEQFLDRMQGDNIVLRLHITQVNRSVSSAVGRAYGYYHDCEGMYYGAEIIYTCNNHGAIQPLRVNSFPHDMDEWSNCAEGILSDWDRGPWHQAKNVVLTHRSRDYGDRELDAGHPVALRHLAVFQGMMLATPAYPMGRVLLDIAARRLDALVRGRVSVWNELVS